MKLDEKARAIFAAFGKSGQDKVRKMYSKEQISAMRRKAVAARWEKLSTDKGLVSKKKVV